MDRVKITKKVIENIKAGSKRLTLHDSEIKGFQCRINPNGSKVYYLYYRTGAGDQRQPKIGIHGEITPEQARGIAKQWLAEVASGNDPSKDRQDKRQGETVEEFCQRYIEQYAKVKKKASSAAMDQLNINSHVIPKLGRLKVANVTRQDIAKLHHRMKKTPYAANRVLALLSKMFNVAELWGARPERTNPCYLVARYKEQKRKRFLSVREVAYLSDTLREIEIENVELPGVVPALRLLIFTGCRRGEILTLKWDHVDIENHCLNLPDSKTGEKKVYLNAPALDVLVNIERVEGNPFVIVGRNKGAGLNNIDKPWLRIKQRTTAAIIKDNAGKGINDVRIHDLRHTYASVAVGGGQTLPVIGKLLGHTQAQTTARYAHLADDPIRAASEAVGATLAAAMQGVKRNSNIVKFPGGE